MDGQTKTYANNRNVFLPKGEDVKRQKPFIEGKKTGRINAKGGEAEQISGP
jgi:hypothetical protein